MAAIGIWDLLATPVAGPVLVLGASLLARPARIPGRVIVPLAAALSSAALAAGYKRTSYWACVVAALGTAFILDLVKMDTGGALTRLITGQEPERTPEQKARIATLNHRANMWIAAVMVVLVVFAALYATGREMRAVPLPWVIAGVSSSVPRHLVLQLNEARGWTKKDKKAGGAKTA